MNSNSSDPRSVRFGVFEVDFAAGELRKRGRRMKLEAQPFQVLSVLVRRPGELVSREDLRKELWPEDTFVEFDHSLNTAVKKIRQALDDSPRNPRYVETAPRQGYRFVAAVESMATGPAEPRTPSRRGLLISAAVALALVGMCTAVWFLLLRKPPAEEVLTSIPLTSYPGEETFASFSPTGNEVAFQWSGGREQNNVDIYVKQLGVDEPFRLTHHPAPDVAPAWSPDGNSVAFARHLSPGRVAYLFKPQRGGPERALKEFDVPAYDARWTRAKSAWTPDGKWLIVTGRERPQDRFGLFLVSVETQARRRLTDPPDKETVDFDGAVSPDGRKLVFCRDRGRFDLYLLRLSDDFTPEGEPERLTFDKPWNMEPAWAADGRDIVFTSGSNLEDRGLWGMTPGKSTAARKLALKGDVVHSPAISRDGRRFAYSASRLRRDIWRMEMPEPGEEPQPPRRFLDSTQFEGAPSFSPDGSRIAFTSLRSGPMQIWVCESDGSHPRPLTSFSEAHTNRPRWSPDGQHIAFYSNVEGNSDIYVVPAAGGEVRRLTSHSAKDDNPEWSTDGGWVYFSSERSGRKEIWKIPASGGEPVAVREEGDTAQESSDGKFLYVGRGWPDDCRVWRVPLEGGAETQVLNGLYRFSEYFVQDDRIYFVAAADENGTSSICFKDLLTGAVHTITQVRHFWWYLAVSPDRSTILYSQIDDAGSDLMLVENFR